MAPEVLRCPTKKTPDEFKEDPGAAHYTQVGGALWGVPGEGGQRTTRRWVGPGGRDPRQRSALHAGAVGGSARVELLTVVI